MRKAKQLLGGTVARNLAVAVLAGLAGSAAQGSVWSGATGNWSSTVSPGWTTGGVPDGTGATADFTGAAAGTTTIDVSSRTVGSVLLGGSVTGTRTIAPTATLGITLNQDGAGSGYALISNSNTNTGSRLSFSAAGTVTLADDLLMSNTGASTGSYSISITSAINGTGNVTFYNVSNSISAGPINMGGTNTFTGSVLVQKGAVTVANTNGLGATANAVTLGSSGNGSATLIITGSGSTLPYSITVASGTGGTLLLGSNNNGGTNTTQTYSGPVLLNGDLSITSLNTGTGALKFSGVISGAGALTKIDAGKLLLTGTNTFTGNTRIGAGTLQLDAASGTTTLALQKSTLDMNAADTGTLNFGSTATTTITNATFAGLTGSRTLALQNINTTPAAVALSIGNNTTDESYSGALTGTGSLIKIGSNTQTLSGTNTYSGTTAINGGILAITGTGSINNSSGITINGGTLLYNSSIGLTQAVSFTGTGGKLLLNGNSSYAGAMTITSGNTLGGSGTYSNTVTINSGATLSPGNSPGQITVGTLQLNSGSTSHMEIGGTVLGTGYDNVTVTDINGLTYGGILEVVSYGSYNLDQNGSYNLFTLNSGTSSGNFSSITVGSTSLTYSAGVWTGINGTATYQFTDATGILTVTIPEPATMSLIFGVMTMGLLPRRRQRA